MRIGHKIAVSLLAVALMGVGGFLGMNLPRAQAVSASGTATGTERTITVSGNSTIQVKPDIAYLSVGVMTSEKEAKKAQEANAKSMEAVLKAVKDKGIKDEDIQTEGLNVWPQYDYKDGGTNKITGYQVTNMLRVKVRDVSKVGEVFDAAIAAGANQSNGITFDVSDPADAQANALEEAYAKAQKRAEVLAKASGTTVDRMIQISESGTSYSPVFRNVAMEASAMDSGAGTGVQSGTVGVSASIDVTFSVK